MSPGDKFYKTFHEWMELSMHRSNRGHMLYAREKGLSRSMIGTLFHLSHRDHSGVTDLGEHLGVSSAAASQMLEHLVEEGLIRRLEDPDDRRMKKITMTEEGTRVMKESVSARMGWIDALEESLSVKEKDQITKAMELIIKKARLIEPSQECEDKFKRSL